MPQTSGLLGGYIYAERDYPQTQFFSWDTMEPSSPLGMRNLVSGHFSFLNIIGQHTANPLEFRNIVLDFTDAISGTYQSLTECLTFRQQSDRFNLSNMRFWMPSGTALTSGHIEFAVSGQWIYNAHLPSGVGGAVPTALPSLPNVRRCDGLGYIDGADDIHSSEFIYLVITVPSGHFLGRWGIGGTGNLGFRLSYDYFQIY